MVDDKIYFLFFLNRLFLNAFLPCRLPNDNNSNLPAAMALVHQETWVRFGTNGIGISDHQNRFSNGVRVANWVENEYGDNLKVRTFRHSCTFHTCMLPMHMLLSCQTPLPVQMPAQSLWPARTRLDNPDVSSDPSPFPIPALERTFSSSLHL